VGVSSKDWLAWVGYRQKWVGQCRPTGRSRSHIVALDFPHCCSRGVDLAAQLAVKPSPAHVYLTEVLAQARFADAGRGSWVRAAVSP
jgi:hypothetical protein